MTDKQKIIQYLLKLCETKDFVVPSQEIFPKEIQSIYYSSSFGQKLNCYEAFSKGLLCRLENIDSLKKKVLIVYLQKNQHKVDKFIVERNLKIQEYNEMKKFLDERKKELLGGKK
jgi:hypothetical protein